MNGSEFALARCLFRIFAKTHGVRVIGKPASAFNAGLSQFIAYGFGRPALSGLCFPCKWCVLTFKSIALHRADRL
jgi:hypothetical protein